MERHADKVQLMRRLYPDRRIEGAIVALAPEPEVQARGAELGMALVC